MANEQTITDTPTHTHTTHNTTHHTKKSLHLQAKYSQYRQQHHDHANGQQHQPPLALRVARCLALWLLQLHRSPGHAACCGLAFTTAVAVAVVVVVRVDVGAAGGRARRSKGPRTGRRRGLGGRGSISWFSDANLRDLTEIAKDRIAPQTHADLHIARLQARHHCACVCANVKLRKLGAHAAVMLLARNLHASIHSLRFRHDLSYLNLAAQPLCRRFPADMQLRCRRHVLACRLLWSVKRSIVCFHDHDRAVFANPNRGRLACAEAVFGAGVQFCALCCVL